MKSHYKFIAATLVIPLALIVLLQASVGLPPTEAAFPGDNGKIAFTSSRDGGSNLEIYAMEPDGTNLNNLTNSAGNDGLLKLTEARLVSCLG